MGVPLATIIAWECPWPPLWHGSVRGHHYGMKVPLATIMAWECPWPPFLLTLIRIIINIIYNIWHESTPGHHYGMGVPLATIMAWECPWPQLWHAMGSKAIGFKL